MNWALEKHFKLVICWDTKQFLAYWRVLIIGGLIMHIQIGDKLKINTKLFMIVIYEDINY